MPIYPNQEIMLIDFDHYFEVLQKKGVLVLQARRTQTFEKISGNEIDVLDEHVWSHGDNLSKLAHRYYGDYTYWWVIALVNKKPTDAHYSVGDNLYIPRNPEFVEGMLRL